MRFSMLLIVTLTASAFAAQTTENTGTAPVRQSAPAGNAENGKKIFTSYGCYQCHNYAAHGGGAGPRLARSRSRSKRSAVRSANQPTKCRRPRRRSSRTKSSQTSMRFC